MSVVAAGGTGLASVVKLTFGSLGTAPPRYPLFIDVFAVFPFAVVLYGETLADSYGQHNHYYLVLTCIMQV
jgi:hypothetical protein